MNFRIKNLDALDPRKMDLRMRSLRVLAHVERMWPKVKDAMPERLQPLAKELETRTRAWLESIPSSVATPAPKADTATAAPAATSTRVKTARKGKKAAGVTTENDNPITHTASDDHPVLEIRSRGASRWALFDRGPDAAPLKVFKSRASAVQAGKRMAKTRHAELRVFNQKGVVQNSFYLN